MLKSFVLFYFFNAVCIFGQYHLIGTFTRDVTGINGSVIINNGNLFLNLDLTNFSNWPASCDNSSLMYHIHFILQNADEGVGANCAKTKAHWDPWNSCGVHSFNKYCAINNSNPLQCIPRPQAKDLTRLRKYNCTRTNKFYPFSCEIGDLSGVEGLLNTTNNLITFTDKNYYWPAADAVKNHTYSIVFHCKNGPPAFCANLYSKSAKTFWKFPSQNETRLTPVRGGKIVATFSKFNNASIQFDDQNELFNFEKGPPAKFNWTNIKCKQGNFAISIFNKWNDNVNDDLILDECKQEIIGSQWDPTHQCYSFLSDSPYCKDGKLCGDSNYTYNCDLTKPIHQYECAPCDLTFSTEYDPRNFSQGTIINGRLLPPLHRFEGKSIVIHCKSKIDNKLETVACARLTNPLSTRSPTPSPTGNTSIPTKTPTKTTTTTTIKITTTLKPNTTTLKPNTTLPVGKHVPPKCNYAAVRNHYIYPTGACITDFMNKKFVSFQYECKNKSKLYLVYYHDNECTIKHTILNETDITNSNTTNHFRCDMNLCDYGVECSYYNCNYNDTCNDCKTANPKTLKCNPYITNQCYGNTDGVSRKSSCSNSTLAISEYFQAENCEKGKRLTTKIYNNTKTCNLQYPKKQNNNTNNNGTHFSGTYHYKTLCKRGIPATRAPTTHIENGRHPKCNYVHAKNHKFYPTDACFTINTTYYKYECKENGTKIFKVYYNYKDCAIIKGNQQSVNRSENITKNLIDFQCKLNDCNYGTTCYFNACKYNNKTQTCSDCEEESRKNSGGYSKIFNKYCTPVIIDNCYGEKKLSHFTCSKHITWNLFNKNVCEGKPDKTLDFLPNKCILNNTFGVFVMKTHCTYRSPTPKPTNAPVVPTTATTSTSAPLVKKKLSAGVIVIIVVCSLLFVGIVVLGIIWTTMKSKMQSGLSENQKGDYDPLVDNI